MALATKLKLSFMFDTCAFRRFLSKQISKHSPSRSPLG